MVAARRLRKSYLGINNSYDNIYIKNKNQGTNRAINKTKNKISIKSNIKIFLFFFTIVVILISNLMFREDLLKNKVFNNVSNEYNNDYDKKDIFNKIERFTTRNAYKINQFIPIPVTEFIKEKYSFIKSYINNVNFSFLIKNNKLNNNYIDIYDKEILLKDSGNIDIYKEIDIYEEKDDKDKNNEIEVLSKLTVEELDVYRIKEAVKSFISPTKGRVTSVYGKRKDPFTGKEKFHEGVDIANNLNTPIVSATTGKVSNIVYNNPNYGNYIQITTNGVVFTYAHLNKINVKLEDNINQGETIALMGNTGRSTSYHLHFEIKIDGRKVNPQSVMSF